MPSPNVRTQEKKRKMARTNIKYWSCFTPSLDSKDAFPCLRIAFTPEPTLEFIKSKFEACFIIFFIWDYLSLTFEFFFTEVIWTCASARQKSFSCAGWDAYIWYRPLTHSQQQWHEPQEHQVCKHKHLYI